MSDQPTNPAPAMPRLMSAQRARDIGRLYQALAEQFEAGGHQGALAACLAASEAAAGGSIQSCCHKTAARGARHARVNRCC